jgi:hypothetical protein
VCLITAVVPDGMILLTRDHGPRAGLNAELAPAAGAVPGDATPTGLAHMHHEDGVTTH